MAPEEVTLEVLTLPDLTPVFTDSIAICTTYPYQLDPGDYRVRGTYLATGEVLEADVTISEGVTTPVDLTFAPPPVTYTLTIATTVGGTTLPAPGTYTYVEGTVEGVAAFPDAGYNFDHWILDGVEITVNPIPVLMDMNHVLTAYFSEKPPPPPPPAIPNWLKWLIALPIIGGVIYWITKPKR